MLPTPYRWNLRSMGGSLWQGISRDRALGAMAWDIYSRSVLEGEKPEFNSIMILPRGLIWSWFFCFRNLLKDRAEKGLGNELV